MYVSAPLAIAIGIIFIMFVPTLRKLVSGMLQGLAYTTEAMNHSMKVGAISIINANEKQLALVESERAKRKPTRSPDEILAEMLKASLPPQ